VTAAPEPLRLIPTHSANEKGSHHFIMCPKLNGCSEGCTPSRQIWVGIRCVPHLRKSRDNLYPLTEKAEAPVTSGEPQQAFPGCHVELRARSFEAGFKRLTMAKEMGKRPSQSNLTNKTESIRYPHEVTKLENQSETQLPPGSRYGIEP
jgi:hypothetical protein